MSEIEVRMSRHREMLWICTVAVVLSFLLTPGGEERLFIAGLGQLPLPQLCQSKAIFGAECPGCGLTRSFVALAHLDWSKAWQLNRVGWVLFAVTLTQIPYRFIALRRRLEHPINPRLAKGFGSFLIGLLVINWIAGIIWLGANGGW